MLQCSMPQGDHGPLMAIMNRSDCNDAKIHNKSRWRSWTAHMLQSCCNARTIRDRSWRSWTAHIATRLGYTTNQDGDHGPLTCCNENTRRSMLQYSKTTRSWTALQDTRRSWTALQDTRRSWTALNTQCGTMTIIDLIVFLSKSSRIIRSAVYDQL